MPERDLKPVRVFGKAAAPQLTTYSVGPEAQNTDRATLKPRAPHDPSRFQQLGWEVLSGRMFMIGPRQLLFRACCEPRVECI